MRFLTRRVSFPVGELGHKSEKELSTEPIKRPTAEKLNRASEKPVKRDVGQRSVRFDESLNLCNKVPANQGHSKACWYTHEEYMNFYDSVKLLCEKVKTNNHKKTDRHYISALTQVFQTCNEMEDEGVLVAGLLESAEEKHLIQGLTHSTAVGLERSVVELISANYSARRKNTYKIVKQIQKDLPSSEFRVQTIRRNMESMSLPSRLFAREMGKAIQLVVLANNMN